MPRLVAGASLNPKGTVAPRIDVPRHTEGFRGAAAEVGTLVQRLIRGRVILCEMPMDHPDRAEGDRQWQELSVALHEALRSAYAHWALLRIELSHEEATALWDAHMPRHEVMKDVGVPQMLTYWRTRTDPPHWMTHEEMREVVRGSWPPAYQTDAINGGITERYDDIPF